MFHNKRGDSNKKHKSASSLSVSTTGNQASKKSTKSSYAATSNMPVVRAASRTSRESTSPTEAPFANKNKARLDILLHAGTFHSVHTWERGTQGPVKPNVLEVLQQQVNNHHRETMMGKVNNSKIETRLIHQDFETQTLDLPGFQVLRMMPQYHFSRLRNIPADQWRLAAHDAADAYCYVVDMSNPKEYLSSSNGGRRDADWERDRFEISQMLCKPSLVENPFKPLVLLVHQTEYNSSSDGNDDELIDLHRLVNLLGLSKLKRPFRAITYSAHDHNLMHALEWIKQTLSDVDSSSTHKEAATAATQSETQDGTGDEDGDDEGSIATITTQGSIINAAFEAGGAYVLDYEPTLQGGNATLQRFEPIKQNSPCPFARSAKLWGGKTLSDKNDYSSWRWSIKNLSAYFDQIAALNAGPLTEFVSRVKQGHALDGFCLEIPQSSYCRLDALGERVCRILTKLADAGAEGNEEHHAMKMGPIDHPHWRFRFAHEDFFITTFSPVYPEDSSRHAFGAGTAFLLFQPMTSFGRHGLVQDTPASATIWDNPASMRDKARVAFYNSGRPYYIPEHLPYPVAEHIVKPENDNGANCIKWWEHLDDIMKENKK